MAMKQGNDKVDKWLASGNKNINGWNVGSFFGDEAFYNGDWLMRAGAAKGGLYGQRCRGSDVPLYPNGRDR
jgi:hypothetical protein